MKRFFIILIVVAINKVKCNDENDDLECKDTGTMSASRRLKEHLFCEYDRSVRPSLGTDNPTDINIDLMPQYVEFSEEGSIVYLHTWVRMKWIDVHLNWKQDKWENLEYIHVKSYEIWAPEITVFSTGNAGDSDDEVFYVNCLVDHEGVVQCVYPEKFSTHCPTDYSEWPYDKHNCTLQIGTWMFFHNEIRLKMENNDIMMHSFMPNKQWNVHIEVGIPEEKIVLEQEEEFTKFITIMLQRHGSRLAMIYILPAFVLMVLTLIVLWLDSQSLERILVACINFICHLLGIFDLHWYFPTSGSETTPKILIFYEVSIGLAAAALIMTCLLRKLRETTVPAPNWLISGTTLILNSPIGRLLKLNITENKKDSGILEDNENNGQIPECTKNRTWQEFSLILEWFSFFICFFIYLIMLTIVLPPGTPKKQSVSYWL